jgi:hypothetical protein
MPSRAYRSAYLWNAIWTKRQCFEGVGSTRHRPIPPLPRRAEPVGPSRRPHRIRWLDHPSARLSAFCWRTSTQREPLQATATRPRASPRTRSSAIRRASLSSVTMYSADGALQMRDQQRQRRLGLGLPSGLQLRQLLSRCVTRFAVIPSCSITSPAYQFTSSSSDSSDNGYCSISSCQQPATLAPPRLVYAAISGTCSTINRSAPSSARGTCSDSDIANYASYDGCVGTRALFRASDT